MATEIVLVRHGETEWSRDRKHTSRTDLPLTDRGREMAVALGATLLRWPFSHVLVSPMQRARDTAMLALPDVTVEVTDDLREWDYGDYEGITTAEIHADHDAGWDLWTDGCPDGESPADVAERADRLIARAAGLDGPVALFAHGHVLRVVAARWIAQGPEHGARLRLDTATVSVLGHEHDRRVIARWNTGAGED